MTKININYDDQVSVTTYMPYLMAVWEEPSALWFTYINKQITAKENFKVQGNKIRKLNGKMSESKYARNKGSTTAMSSSTDSRKSNPVDLYTSIDIRIDWIGQWDSKIEKLTWTALYVKFLPAQVSAQYSIVMDGVPDA